MGGVKSRMKAFLNKILLQIWNAEDEGKKIFIDSEELGKTDREWRKILPLGRETTCFTRRKVE